LTLPLTLRAAARAEFDEAFDWYETQQPGLGVTFASRIHEAFDRISAGPALYPVVFGDVRRAVVRRFPYAIFFRVRPQRIVVLAVFHGSRDPRIWQSRT
jgi:plasmid stabilization system protein ParE